MASKEIEVLFYHLRSRLSTFPNKADGFLQHFSRLLTTSTGLDNTLATVLFTSTLLHSQLLRLSNLQQNRIALTLASKAKSDRLPSEIAILATLNPPSTPLSQLCERVKALADTAGELWIALRLFGLFHIYVWARAVFAKPHRDPAIKVLLWAQIIAATCFQGLENAAFLASKGVMRLSSGSPKKEAASVARWMAVSNRFWMAQVLLEGLRLWRVKQLGWREELGAEKIGDDDGEMAKVQSKELEGRWKRQFFANAGWLPMTLHWSYVDEMNSPVREIWQGVAGLIPSVIGLQDAWRETMKP